VGFNKVGKRNRKKKKAASSYFSKEGERKKGLPYNAASGWNLSLGEN
jgi:hypothetical protein